MRAPVREMIANPAATAFEISQNISQIAGKALIIREVSSHFLKEFYNKWISFTVLWKLIGTKTNLSKKFKYFSED